MEGTIIAISHEKFYTALFSHAYNCDNIKFTVLQIQLQNDTK